MTRRNNPKVSQRAISAALRRYRAKAGVTLEDAARAGDYDSGSLSRAEQAKATPHPAVVRALLAYYGEDDSTVLDNYAALAKHGRKRGWWNQYSDLMTVAYVGLESAATRICWLENQFIPGLLQTESYTRALIEAEVRKTPDEEVERRLRVRAERRKIVTDNDEPCELCVIIDEAILMRPVGTRQVMADQLDQVLQVSRQRNISVQVLPFSAGGHGSLGARFVILDFADADDPGTVFLEQIHWKDDFVEEAVHVQIFRDAFAQLQSAAETPKNSRAMIAQARDKLLGD